MDQREGIIQKIAFRLVRKYLAGSTTASVLNTVRQINDKGMHATVTLLNDHVSDLVKAKYNANAYAQIAKQISRLHLNSDISVRPSQLGYSIDKAAFEKNMEELLDAAKSSGVSVWIEDEVTLGSKDRIKIYRSMQKLNGGIGLEMITDPEDADKLEFDSIGKGDVVRLWYTSKFHRGKKEAKAQQAVIEKLCATKASVTVSSHDIKWMQKMVQNGLGKRNITFEIPLGYNTVQLAKAAKGKGALSVYVPYGKDWGSYIRNRIADGKRRGIAVKMLTEADNGETNGKRGATA